MSPGSRGEKKSRNDDRSRDSMDKLKVDSSSHKPGAFYKKDFADLNDKEYRSPAEKNAPVDNYYQNMYQSKNLRTAKMLYKSASHKNVIAEEDMIEKKNGTINNNNNGKNYISSAN